MPTVDSLTNKTAWRINHLGMIINHFLPQKKLHDFSFMEKLQNCTKTKNLPKADGQIWIQGNGMTGEYILTDNLEDGIPDIQSIVDSKN